MAAQYPSRPITHPPVCSRLRAPLQRYGAQPPNTTQDCREEPPRDRDLRHLKRLVSRMAHHLRADLNRDFSYGRRHSDAGYRLRRISVLSAAYLNSHVPNVLASILRGMTINDQLEYSF